MKNEQEQALMEQWLHQSDTKIEKRDVDILRKAGVKDFGRLVHMLAKLLRNELRVTTRGYQPSGLSTGEIRFLEAGGAVLPSSEEAEELLNDALFKTAAEYALMIERSLTQKEVAALLSVSTSRVRQRLDARSLYAVPTDSGRVCPAWQFMEGQSLPGLDKVLPVLKPNLHPLTVQGFFYTPQPDLESDQHHRFLTPREWLFAGYPVKPVVVMARDL